MSYQVKYVQYAMFSVAITCIGLLINFLNIYFSLDKKGLESELPEGLVGTVSIFSSIYMGTWNWICTFFSKLHLNVLSDGLSESVSYSLFGNDKSGVYNFYFLNSLFEEGKFSVLPSFILVLITILLIGAAGYILYIVHRMNWKECLIFAGIFTALQLMLIYFVNIQLDFEATGKIVQFSFAFEMIATVLLVFIVSFASFAAGGFLRQYQLKK
ncbi:hypothetical protein [Lysinibacillus sp. NPDC096212]|uniref:hypothetical protein n=1 Tax=Lysinibacillus sp. NPDC096212 TaxID=3364135 RepID=UPI00381829DE